MTLPRDNSDSDYDGFYRELNIGDQLFITHRNTGRSNVLSCVVVDQMWSVLN